MADYELTLESDSALGNIEEVFAASPSDLQTAGGLYWAPFGTPLPEDVDEPLSLIVDEDDNPWWKNFGFVGPDGVDTNIDGKTVPIEVWGGDEIGALRDKFAIDYSCLLYQYLSPSVNAAIWGKDHVSTQAATADHGNRMRVYWTNKLPKKISLVLDSVFEDKLLRQIAQIAQLSDLGKITQVHNKPLALNPTFKVLKGRNGVHITQYSDDGQKLEV